MKKPRLLLALVPLAAVAVLAAGCGGGGGGGGVPADAVAVVGSTSITKAQLNDLMKQATGQAKATGQAAPKVGTAAYTALRDRVVAYLVQVTELEQEAPKLGVSVTQADVQKQLDQIAKLHYGGSQKKLDAAIAKSGLTVAEAEQQLKVNLLAQAIEKKVIAGAKVSKSDELAYYKQNKASFSTPAQTTRSVRHILVNSKGLANKLETQLRNGASFAALAKQYSKDPGSAQQGGKMTAVKGQLVPQFQSVAFSLKNGQISQPVHSQFGWHIIQALGPVKNTPAHTASFKQVEAQIRQNLLSQKQQALWGEWLAKMAKDFKGKVRYQTGYAPATTASTTPVAPTTTG